MEVRIAATTEGATTTVTIDGRLSGAAVEELVRRCNTIDGPLVLDLSGLLHADAAGVAALRSLRDAGAKLVSACRYIELLLAHQEPVRSGRR